MGTGVRERTSFVEKAAKSGANKASNDAKKDQLDHKQEKDQLKDVVTNVDDKKPKHDA